MICRIFQKMGEKKNGVLVQGPSSCSMSSYMQEASNSSLSHLVDQSLKAGSGSALALQSFQSQNLLLINNIPHETDLKSLLNNSSSSSSSALAVSQPSAFPSNNVLQTSSCSPAKTKMKQDNDLLKTLLPHQDYYCSQKQQVPFPKICKTESNNFSHFQSYHSSTHHPPPPNFRYPVSACGDYDMIMNTPNYKQSPLVFRGSDNGNKSVMGICGGGGAAASCGFQIDGADTDMSTSSSCSRPLPFSRPGFRQMLLLDPPTKITAGESWPFHF